jgi:hypothetical protein
MATVQPFGHQTWLSFALVPLTQQKSEQHIKFCVTKITYQFSTFSQVLSELSLKKRLDFRVNSVHLERWY